MKKRYIPLYLILGSLGGFWLAIYLSAHGMTITWPFVKRGEFSIAQEENSFSVKRIFADPAADKAKKCQAIFSLFAHQVQDGMNRQAVSDIFPDKNWVDISSFSINKLEMGKQYVRCGSNCEHVVLFLFSNLSSTAWSIHLCLEGEGDKQDAINFFRNTGETSFTAVRNFTLIYPPMSGYSRSEEFLWWGISVQDAYY
jgi:hypothetical protein